MDENEYEIVTDEEVEDIREALEKGTLATAAEKIQEYFNQLDNVTLNITITGESGSGKSTFVNAFRGIGDDDEINSAPTGVVETTMEPKSYPHPKYPSDVESKRYDFFIIIASERFRSSNVQLAIEIQKMKKRFYFVRSKIDENIRADKNKENL
uniref:IRG-type G domain-containing protein n=1 Tax=Paramormyrops kingsleyae TaxID=1676925 RepID=A0A3B3S8Q1_9TELE